MSLIKIRDFVINIFDVVLSMIKIIFLTKITFNFKLKSYRDQSLIILANGPSLNSTLENHEFIHKHNLLCVNYFGRTDEYVRFKPSFYVITSLEYFFKDEKEELVTIRKRTLEDIATKTDWPLILFLPAKAKQQNEWKKYLQIIPISLFIILIPLLFQDSAGFLTFAIQKTLECPDLITF